MAKGAKLTRRKLPNIGDELAAPKGGLAEQKKNAFAAVAVYQKELRQARATFDIKLAKRRAKLLDAIAEAKQYPGNEAVAAFITKAQTEVEEINKVDKQLKTLEESLDSLSENLEQFFSELEAGDRQLINELTQFEETLAASTPEEVQKMVMDTKLPPKVAPVTEEEAQVVQEMLHEDFEREAGKEDSRHKAELKGRLAERQERLAKYGLPEGKGLPSNLARDILDRGVDLDSARPRAEAKGMSAQRVAGLAFNVRKQQRPAAKLKRAADSTKDATAAKSYEKAAEKSIAFSDVHSELLAGFSTAAEQDLDQALKQVDDLPGKTEEIIDQVTEKPQKVDGLLTEGQRVTAAAKAEQAPKPTETPTPEASATTAPTPAPKK